LKGNIRFFYASGKDVHVGPVTVPACISQPRWSILGRHGGLPYKIDTYMSAHGENDRAKYLCPAPKDRGVDRPDKSEQIEG